MSEDTLISKNIFVIIQCGFEGIEKLVYSSLNEDEVREKIISIRTNILHAKRKMKQIVDNHDIEHYENMYYEGEISDFEYNMANYEQVDSYCIQQWNGNNFFCACDLLKVNPSKD